MKKIINGKLYNTETAERVGRWSNGRSTRDFTWCREELYRKKTGEFFLYGEGGPQSPYIRYIDSNSWCGDERIIPMTYDEARDWAERKLDADEYESIFGEVAEDDSTVDVHYQLAAATVEKLKRASSRTGKTQAQLIAELVDTL